jgi:hypothetical protein
MLLPPYNTFILILLIIKRIGYLTKIGLIVRHRQIIHPIKAIQYFDLNLIIDKTYWLPYERQRYSAT